jgi:acyl-CoA thioesterase FadM
VTEHFTVAYHFDRLEEAAANLADDFGLSNLQRGADLPCRIDARFTRELRAGACFHIESSALSIGSQESDNALRLGHRFVDSANGEVVTWFDQHLDLSAAPLTPQQRGAIQCRLAVWNGPTAEPRPEPFATDSFIPTARGRIRPGDVDVAGHFALGAIVHRFSSASGQLSAAVGMDADLMHQQRRGFSTFELILRISAALPLEAPYLVETGIAHLGNSSLRMIHRMTNPRTGAEVARLSQFGVNLDLDSRRPARWTDDIRRRMAALIGPVGQAIRAPD